MTTTNNHNNTKHKP